MRKYFIKLIACFIFNKNQRKVFRNKYIFAPNIINNGINNKVILVNSDGTESFNPKIHGLKIFFLGNNNLVKLYAPLPQFIDCEIQLVEQAKFILHSSPYHLRNFIVWKMKKGTICEIGENFSCEGVQIALHGEENLKCIIGKNCMFSHDVYIQPTDNHSIIDDNTKKAINIGKDIIIGNNVWLAPYTFILKGVQIKDWNIIGVHSVVTKSTDSNSVYVGIPARKIKKILHGIDLQH